MPWRSLIAWLLVLPVAGWVVLRAFGLEEGYPLVPLLAYTPLAVAGAVAVFVVALLLRRRAPALRGRWLLDGGARRVRGAAGARRAERRRGRRRAAADAC